MGNVQTRVFPSLQTRRNAVVDEGIHRTGFFDRHNRGDVEVFDFACDVRVESTGIKPSNSPDTRSTVHDIVPSRSNIIAHWAHDAKTCYDDSSLHGSLLICDNGGQAVWSSTTIGRET